MFVDCVNRDVLLFGGDSALEMPLQKKKWII
jgi:hypothetical protein